MTIRGLELADWPEWHRIRCLLWPHDAATEHEAEMRARGWRGRTRPWSLVCASREGCADSPKWTPPRVERVGAVRWSPDSLRRTAACVTVRTTDPGLVLRRCDRYSTRRTGYISIRRRRGDRNDLAEVPGRHSEAHPR